MRKGNMLLNEITLSGDVQGSLLIPERRGDLGVVVVAGSSGRVDVARAKLFAAHGAVALALRWFGGDGQTPGICEVTLETFIHAIDRLGHEGCDRIAFVSTSKGAEAALLVAIHDARVDFVIAISPTSVVWGNLTATILLDLSQCPIVFHRKRPVLETFLVLFSEKLLSSLLYHLQGPKPEAIEGKMNRAFLVQATGRYLLIRWRSVSLPPTSILVTAPSPRSGAAFSSRSRRCSSRFWALHARWEF